MAIFSLAVLTTGVTNATATVELRTGATYPIQVREIGLTLTAATSSTFGIGRPAAIGVTPTSPITLLAQDPVDTGVSCSMATAWATGPTVPAQFFRRVTLPATVGSGLIWSFARKELVVPVSSSLVIWNLATGSAINCWFVVDE